MPRPPGPKPPPVNVQVSDVPATNGRIAFTATFDNHAPEEGTGQE